MMSPGTKLGGRYRLDERIATGGMGDVWRATDEVLGREVAAKVLLPSLLNEPGFIERFRAEARMVATLTHSNIVRVYDYGESPMAGGGGVAYLVMEFISGEALTAKLKRRGRLSADEALPILAQAADALHAAHVAGVIHRDVKPGNLLINDSGTVMLTDFGIARSGLTGGLTQAGSVLGTAAYVSPEQASGQTVTGQSDVYSLGIVAYQCLAGQRPWDSDNPVELVMRHVNDTPPPLPDDVPPAAKAFVAKALEKDPANRFESAEAMAHAARRAASQLGAPVSTHMPPVTPAPPGPPVNHGTAVPPPGRGLDDRTSVAAAVDPNTPAPLQRRNRLLLIVSAAALGVILLVGAVWAVGLNGEGSNADPGDDGETSKSAEDNGDKIEIDPADYLNRPPMQVAKELEDLGFEVTVVGNGRFVNSVTPSGALDPETEITLETSNRQVDPGSSSDPSSPGDSPTPDKSCNLPICPPN